MFGVFDHYAVIRSGMFLQVVTSHQYFPQYSSSVVRRGFLHLASFSAFRSSIRTDKLEANCGPNIVKKTVLIRL